MVRVQMLYKNPCPSLTRGKAANQLLECFQAPCRGSNAYDCQFPRKRCFTHVDRVCSLGTSVLLQARLFRLRWNPSRPKTLLNLIGSFTQQRVSCFPSIRLAITSRSRARISIAMPTQPRRGNRCRYGGCKTVGRRTSGFRIFDECASLRSPLKPAVTVKPYSGSTHGIRDQVEDQRRQLNALLCSRLGSWKPLE
jgi:hypothetical protein